MCALPSLLLCHVTAGIRRCIRHPRSWQLDDGSALCVHQGTNSIQHEDDVA